MVRFSLTSLSFNAELCFMHQMTSNALCSSPREPHHLFVSHIVSPLCHTCVLILPKQRETNFNLHYRARVCSCVCVCSCMYMHACRSLFWLCFILCLVCGETAHKRVHYYYTLLLSSCVCANKFMCRSIIMHIYIYVHAATHADWKCCLVAWKAQLVRTGPMGGTELMRPLEVGT